MLRQLTKAELRLLTNAAVCKDDDPAYFTYGPEKRTATRLFEAGGEPLLERQRGDRSACRVTAAGRALLERRSQAEARVNAGTASDDDRILLAVKRGTDMHGPDEPQPCEHHAGEFNVYRWTWPAPADLDDEAAHRTALEGGADGDLVSTCPRCAEENERELMEDML